ncbi:MAG: hypothetical protein Q7K21_08830, partial [Elusimicrobiota bacterium]|nr:hypothetical protein [Elusimicrobiota bacterium]
MEDKKNLRNDPISMGSSIERPKEVPLGANSNNNVAPTSVGVSEANKIKFGTDGWRGIIAKDFTFENIGIAAQAIADYVKQSEVGNSSCRACSVENKPTKVGNYHLPLTAVIGYDNRFLSEKFALH